MPMVTYREFRVRGAIAGFADAVCVWTLRVYDDETLTATIMSTSANSPALVLFSGQASQSTPQSPFILRFQLARHPGTENPAQSWAIDCKAQLEPVSSLVRGTWSFVMATPPWQDMWVGSERDNQNFRLECLPNAVPGVLGEVRSLKPLNVGRYAFQGVLVDEQAAWTRPILGELLIKDSGELGGHLTIDHERPRALCGMWDRGICTWKDDHGLLVNAQVDNVLLIGAWSYNAGTSGWFELVIMVAARQWTWKDHNKTPRSLQKAFSTCQQLGLPGVDDSIWHQIFSCCHYDWFEG